MNKKWLIRLLAILLLASAAPAHSQQATKTARIGFVVTTAAAASNQDVAGHLIETFRQTLSELGYTEGKNIQFEYRYIEGATRKGSGSRCGTFRA
jgi:Skp family chaperone for outer membrane proteins